MNPIQSAVALALIAFVPGFFLVKALFPRPRAAGFDALLTGFLSVATSLAITIVVGVVLGFLPAEGRGYFQAAGSGFPFIESSLALVSVALAAVAWRRGAFRRESGAPVGPKPAEHANLEPLLANRLTEAELESKKDAPADAAALAASREESRRLERGAIEES
ncbi:MAG TPA: DUF1616 domain-containing protein [Candidatus Thermoplasmatota archaeon]|nr:DUF1616 domain-containing protein [Candidatus Thermoplasmatota archaeon]